MRLCLPALLGLLLATPPAAAASLPDAAECLRQALMTYLQYPVRFEGALDDQGGGAFTQHDVVLVTSGPNAPAGRISSLDVYAFDCAGFQAGGVPSRLSLRANGVSVAPVAHPLTSLLPGLGSDRLFDVTLDFAYAAEGGRLTLNHADLEFPGLLTLTLTGQASGIALAGARFTAKGLAALGLAAAFQGSLEGLELWLWNESGGRLLEAFARGQGRTLEQQRALWLSQLDALLAEPANATAAPVLRPLRQFVLEPGQLRLHLAPPAGHVELGALLAAGTLAEQLRLLGLTAAASR
jgi:hypothetical protein